MTKTGLEFGISVIVICLIFDIWNFYSSNTPVLQNSSQSLLAKPLNKVHPGCHSPCLKCWDDELTATG
jgi:hypothetical protein